MHPPPRATLTDPLLPYTQLFLSSRRRESAGSQGRPARNRPPRRAPARRLRCPAWRRSHASDYPSRSSPPPVEAQQLRVEGDDYGAHRSEEHTSELQSLMRISYADFCLKKKKIEL